MNTENGEQRKTDLECLHGPFPWKSAERRREPCLLPCFCNTKRVCLFAVSPLYFGLGQIKLKGKSNNTTVPVRKTMFKALTVGWVPWEEKTLLDMGE